MERIEIEFDNIEGAGPSPTGSSRMGYVSYEEREQYLVDHIRAYLLKSEWEYLSGFPTLTVHHCWSGYSEYTITSTWDEIGIQWGSKSAFFPKTSEFLLALATTEPRAY